MNRSAIILMFTILLLSVCSSNAFDVKETEVPQSVVAALKAKYPPTQITKWEAEKADRQISFGS
jgi:hypothetical protein